MNMKWIVLAIAASMYLLVILFQDKKVFFTTAAAVLLIVLSTLMPNQIFRGDGSRSFALLHSVRTLINWNVLMIYVGSMTIAALFIYSRVPIRISDLLIKWSPSTGIAIVLILAMTGIISIFVENVATVLVMAPIALALSRKFNLNPTYFLTGLAVMSNLEGTATLVGDPPSMIFASYAGYSFNDFFMHQGKISIFFFIQFGMLTGCAFFYFYFHNIRKKADIEQTPVISYFPAMLLIAMILGLAAISFLHITFKYASGLFVLALGLAGLAWFALSQKKTRAEIRELVRKLDWETIFFLCGIFVVVGAIAETGLLKEFSNFLASVTGGRKIIGFLLIIIVSMLISGFVDNVPYIIVMLPVAHDLAVDLQIFPELYMFALLVGSCLGGNLTPFGASANIVTMGILKREGHPMTFKGWLKIGAPFTAATTTVAAAILWAVWS